MALIFHQFNNTYDYCHFQKQTHIPSEMTSSDPSWHVFGRHGRYCSRVFRSISLPEIFSFLDSWSGSKLGRQPAAAWRFPLTHCLVPEVRQDPSSSSSHSTSLSPWELIAVPNTNHLLTSVTGNIQGLNGHVSSLLGSSLYLPRFPLSFPPFCLSFDADFLSLQAAFAVSSVSFL